MFKERGKIPVAAAMDLTESNVPRERGKNPVAAAIDLTESNVPRERQDSCSCCNRLN